MTDEEKADEYIFHTYYVKDLTKEDKDLLREEVRMMHRRKIKAYLNGLAEGRTEQRRLQIAYSGVLEKENAELKEKIEKMKCCENCKHSFWGNELECGFFGYDEEMKCLNDKHGWELEE